MYFAALGGCAADAEPERAADYWRGGRERDGCGDDGRGGGDGEDGPMMPWIMRSNAMYTVHNRPSDTPSHLSLFVATPHAVSRASRSRFVATLTFTSVDYTSGGLHGELAVNIHVICPVKH